MSPTDRRSFTRSFGLAAVGILGLQAAWSTVRFAQAPVSYGPPLKRNIGPLDRFPIGATVFVEDAGVFVQRDHRGVRAMSAMCTHLGCTVRREDEGFVCPCHGSRYDEQGTVVAGPAPAALSFFKIEQNKQGQLVVDLGHPVDADTRLRNA